VNDRIKWKGMSEGREKEYYFFNLLTPNGHYSVGTAPLTSKICILYVYSTNLGTEYFKHVMYSLFFFSSKCSLFRNSNVFSSCIIHILCTDVLKLKENNSGAKRLKCSLLVQFILLINVA